jgi:uncharacterized membrane protein
MGLKSHFKSKLLAGILTLIPLGVTFFVLRFLFTTIDGLFAPIMAGVLGEQYRIGMGLLATILLVYLVGLIVSNFVGRKLVGAGERILTKIPLVREVYSPVRQLVQMILTPSNHDKFKRAVAIKTPASLIRIIGFVTGDVREEDNPAPLISVFVPTSPNPTTGVVLFCDPEIVYETNMRVETAMKMLVSGGIVAPDNFTIQREIQHLMKIESESE